MAINKDPGDNRTYTSNITKSYDWRIPTVNNSTTTASNTYLNFPGRIANLGIANVSVAFYTCTFYDHDEAADIRVSTTSGVLGPSKAVGLTGSTSVHGHAQLPGAFFAPFSVNGMSNGTLYVKVNHSTDTSDQQTITKSS